MKYLVVFFLLSGLYTRCVAQSNQQPIVVKCGVNEVKLDSAVSLTCDFFTDTLIRVYFENPQNLHRIQAVYMFEGREPATAWFNIDVDSRAAVFSPRSSFFADFCKPSRLIIYYHSNNINIQQYTLNIDL